jgi:hypothetical protein
MAAGRGRGSVPTFGSHEEKIAGLESLPYEVVEVAFSSALAAELDAVGDREEDGLYARVVG